MSYTVNNCSIDCGLKGKACAGQYAVYDNGAIWAMYGSGSFSLRCASEPKLIDIERQKNSALEEMK